MLRDSLLPAVTLVVVGSMVLPLPPALLDLLLAGNMLLALLLLASSFYVTEPLKLSSLPAILLLSTLFRLALTISTTRLILSKGDAGSVVTAFGELMVGNDVVTGVTIFLVITLVQFVVVAKGAERVAEVSARFALDAMPGKQMAIDADLRAGVLDAQTARQRRQDLQSESRFYGALDGAMKFVKGDAIAGMLIVALNAIGGLLVGVLSRELDLSTAVSTYTILTVGEGLLSQIPAFLSAIAAAVVVTRVAREDGVPLAREVPDQLFQIRTVRGATGCAAFVLALVPGLPALPFALTGAALVASLFITRQPTSSVAGEASPFLPTVPPLLKVAVPRCLYGNQESTALLANALEQARTHFYDRSGIFLIAPTLVPSFDDTLRLSLRGMPIAEVSAEGNQEEMTQAVIRVFDTIAPELIDDISTRRLLDMYDRDFPELISSVVPAVISVTQLTVLLRALCEEDVSIRSFDLVLQAAAESVPRVGTGRVLLEEVRIALRRQIVHGLEARTTIEGYVLDPLVDLACVNAERQHELLDPSCIAQIVECAEQRGDAPWVFVASRGARRLVWDLLRTHRLTVPVLALEELDEFTIIGRVSFSPSLTAVEALAA